MIVALVRIPFKDHSEVRHDKDHSEDWGMGDDGVRDRMEWGWNEG
jgi:hypothetical protein